MDHDPNTASWFAEVARLRADVERMADYVVARARAAHRLGITAEAHRINADGLDRQAGRAEILLFCQAVETFRAAAADSRLVADALEVLEGRLGL